MSRGTQRVRVLSVFLAVAAVVLIARLAKLQIADHWHWTEERIENQRRFEVVAAPRGGILDRRGSVLAVDESQFVLNVNYKHFRKGSPLGLVLHLEHLARSIHESGHPEFPLLRAHALRYVDDPREYEAVLVRLLDVPSLWLHKKHGGLTPDVSSALRFYAFECMRHVQGVARPSTQGVVSREFHERSPEPSSRSVFEVLGPRLAPGDPSTQRARVIAGMRAWLARGFADIELLERQIDDGTWLRERLDFIDQHLRKLTKDRIKERIKKEKKRKLSWFERLRRWVRDDEVDLESLEFRLEQRFALEDAAWEVRKPVEFSRIVALVAGKRELYPGFTLSETKSRRYPRPPARSSLAVYRFLGSVGSPKPTEDPTSFPFELLRRRKNLSDSEWEVCKQQIAHWLYDHHERRVGKSGLEYLLEDQLRSRRGARQLWRDRRGVERGEAWHLAASSGQSVQLTIDAEVQDIALEALRRARDRYRLPGDQHAALTLIDVETGDTLCMAWLPEQVSDEKKGDTWVLYTNLVTDYRETATIGSVFKPFVAIDALESGREIDYDHCPNRVDLAGMTVRCNHNVPHIRPDFLFEEAILHSCNAFFVKIGTELSTRDFERIARRFGLDDDGKTRPALGLGLDRNGWRRNERYGARRAIGYGIWATPLSLARAYAGLATGRLPPYRLVTAVDGKPVAPGRPVELGISERHLARVRTGLRLTVDPLGHGTARATGLHEFRVAAKTGSPEIKKGKSNNAWLCGYLPNDPPRLAFACAFYGVPDGMHGGDVAAAAVYELLSMLVERPEYADVILKGARLR